jgi:DNA gyrase subunit A
MLISKQGMVVRVAVKGISKVGRSTQGVRVISLKSSDKLTSVASVVPAEEEDVGEESPE